eukprot:10799431-Alexandrium_andersonii.AAC.1
MIEPAGAARAREAPRAFPVASQSAACAWGPRRPQMPSLAATTTPVPARSVAAPGHVARGS